MQFVIVYQREPHARQVAFGEIGQSSDTAERFQLAAKACVEFGLPRDILWIDGLDDQSRAFFGDLPSPAVLIDPVGTIQAKLPWGEPEAIRPELDRLLGQAAARLEGPPEELGENATPRQHRSAVGKSVWQQRRAGKQIEATTRNAALWAAAAGVLPKGRGRNDGQQELSPAAAAALVANQPKAEHWNQWLQVLLASKSPAVRHWALQRWVRRLRAAEEQEAQLKSATAQLAALRKEHPWVSGSPPD